MTNDFWQGRRVFITGHTGFRGSWLSLTLQRAGAQVFGFALPPATSPNFFDVGNVGQGMTSTFSDVRDAQSLKSALDFSQAEIVFHLAGGGGLKDSWNNVPEIFSTQVMGTINLLESLRETATTRAVVILTSDKVYRNPKDNRPFKEEDPLGGNAPIAAAKACEELIVESYLQGIFSPQKYNKHKIAICTVRLGAVIGGGDFSSDSLIYQLAQACRSGIDLPLRNPDSVRTWMHIEDATEGLMVLGQALILDGPKNNGSWNLAGTNQDYARVEMVKSLFQAAYTGDVVTSSRDEEKTQSLHGVLNIEKIQKTLGWQRKISFIEGVKDCAKWYRNFFTSGQSSSNS